MLAACNSTVWQPHYKFGPTSVHEVQLYDMTLSQGETHLHGMHAASARADFAIILAASTSDAVAESKLGSHCWCKGAVLIHMV